MNLDCLPEPFVYLKLVKFRTNNNVSTNVPMHGILYSRNELYAHCRLWQSLLKFGEVAYCISEAADGHRVYVTITHSSIEYREKMTNEFLVRIMAS